MSIHYSCRYCGQHLGTIHNRMEEEILGFHALTEQEKENILQQDGNGDWQAKVVCEHCQESLERYPEWVLLSSIHH